MARSFIGRQLSYFHQHRMFLWVSLFTGVVVLLVHYVEQVFPNFRSKLSVNCAKLELVEVNHHAQECSHD